MKAVRLSALLALAGCDFARGDWFVQTWGEEFIEQGIPSDVFADGCSVVYDTFALSFVHVGLEELDDESFGDIGPEAIYDLTVPGPVTMGRDSVFADVYSCIEVHVGPDEDAVSRNASSDTVVEMIAAGASVLASGTLTCPTGSVLFSWMFDTDTRYDCDPEGILQVHKDGLLHSQITVHGDQLFLDALENPDAEVRGQAMFDADADADGVITLEELDAVSIPELGYDVGSQSDVSTLRQFVSRLSRTLVHLDGDVECGTNLPFGTLSLEP